MALSLSKFLVSAALVLPNLFSVQAATVNYEFNVGWVKANPDAMFERPVMGINGQWPIPALKVTKGDRLVVKVNNQLGNDTTSLHWHGIYQNGTPHMDGPVGVSQCEIPNGGSFIYNFTIDQPGTYWFHSHTRGQYPDGLRAPLIVEDPDDPFKDQYDEQIVLSFSDWYHDLIKPLLTSFISVSNPTGAEPVPNAALMNDTQNLTVPIQPGKTYMIRMVNMAAFAAMNVWFEGHTVKVVEVDGVYTQPAEANMLYITAAQRYSVLLTAKNTTDANFPIVASMDQDLFDTIPDGLNPNVTGWLVYDKSKEMPDAKLVDAFDLFDDVTLIPHDGQKLFDKVDRSITLNLSMNNLGDGGNYAFFNNVTYVGPKVPTLYSVMSTGESATNPFVYGTHTNSFVLNGGETIELIINNNDPGKHPLHLHGHEFQIVQSQGDVSYDPSNLTTPNPIPSRRDTVLVQPNGNVVLRFRSANPGVWLFHCHIEWHVASGLMATFVEDPLAIQKIQIPTDHYSVCAANSPAIPTTGNAAGNTVNVLDLSGEPSPPNPLPAGFTARGIVALVFSVVSAFLGMAVIAWYGAQPIASGGAAGAGAKGVGNGAGHIGNGTEGTGAGVLGREGGVGNIVRSEAR